MCVGRSLDFISFQKSVGQPLARQWQAMLAVSGNKSVNLHRANRANECLFVAGVWAVVGWLWQGRNGHQQMAGMAVQPTLSSAGCNMQANTLVTKNSI